MSYTKTTWVNDTAPALNETNLNKIEQGIYDNDSHIGDLTTLTTTADTDLVSAVNELDGNIGDLTSLTTTADTDLVSAINEVDAQADDNTAKLSGTQVAGDMVVDSIRTKNIYNGVYTSKKYIARTNGSIESSGDWSATDYIKIKPNTTYTFSGITNAYSGTAGTSFYNSSRTFISSISSTTQTFTTPNNAQYVRISLNNETPTGVQLEEGSTATTYKPYQELNNQEVYSTGEAKIGTWVNGKPLYRKVVYVGSKPNETNVTINNVVSNLDTLVRMSGTAYNSGYNQYYNIPNAHSTIASWYINAILVDKTDLQIRGGDGWNTANGLTNIYVTLEYTKTTD